MYEKILIGNTVPVLDKGFIQLIDYMGTDETIVNAARTSYGNEELHSLAELEAASEVLGCNVTNIEVLQFDKQRNATCLRLDIQGGSYTAMWLNGEAGKLFSSRKTELLEKLKTNDEVLLRLLLRHSHGTPFEMCLAGDVEIPTFPCKGAKVKMYPIQKIAEAFDKGGKENSWAKLLNIRTVNPETNLVTSTKIKRAWKKGVEKVYELIVEFPFRRSIKATATHKFLTESGEFKQLGELVVGDKVMLNGVPATSSDAVPKDKCEVPNCGVEYTEIHHIDENPHNNNSTNLRRVCRKHHKHAHTITLLEKAVPGIVASIKYVGTVDVYDIETFDDNHTFVANGFVVHNCEVMFRVQVPMDCWRQWIRHRTANVNEYSTRYTEAIDEMQCTDPDQWRLQAKDNKQGSSGYLIEWPNSFVKHDSVEGYDYLDTGYASWYSDIDPNGFDNPGTYLSEKEKVFHEAARALYKERLAFGIAKEQARKDLPLSTYTRAYWKCDLRNIFHFLKLRMDSHAQLEIRQYASAMASILKQLYPVAYKAFEDYSLNAVTFSVMEMECIRGLRNNHQEMFEGTQQGLENWPKPDSMTKREWNEFRTKLGE